MSSTYSTNLAIELPATGDQAGTWGNTVNNNLGTLIEQAISGYVSQAITDGADTVITIPNGASGVARNMTIVCTGALTAGRNLIVPANTKLYFILNSTTGGFAVTVKVSGQTGIAVPNGKSMLLVCNGTDVIVATNYLVGTATNATTATTATTANTANSAVTLSATLAASLGGTGLAGPAANSVVVSNGNNPMLLVAAGTLGNVLTDTGTGWASQAPAAFAGVLPPVNGGTGLANMAAHNVLVGNGNSAATMVAPSTAGFVLTSNGASSDPSFQAISSTTYNAIGSYATGTNGGATTGSTYSAAAAGISGGSGTWRCMGFTGNSVSVLCGGVTITGSFALFVRIS